VKSGLPLLPDPGGPGGAEMGSLSRLQEYLTAAPSPTVVGEDAISYVITFNLGPDYFTREIDRLRPRDVNPGRDANDAAIANRDVELTFTISKANYLVSEVNEKVVTHGVQAGGDALTEMDFKLYGYDTPISIIVPPEAQNAPEVPLPGY